MNLIDLAFINKFANSQLSEGNSSSNIIYKKQLTPRFTNTQPVINEHFDYNDILPISRILIVKNDTFNPTGPAEDSEIYFSGALEFYSIPAGCYIVFQDSNGTPPTPYICGFTVDSTENNLLPYKYTSVKPWEEQINKWSGYSAAFYGFTMPELEPDTMLTFVVDGK